MSKLKKNPVNHRLSDTQLIALSSASEREDGAITFPDRVKGAAALKIVSSLADKGLAREIRAKIGMPVARHDEDGRPFALVITKLGRAAINAEEEVSAGRDLDREIAKVEVDASAKRSRVTNATETPKNSAIVPVATKAPAGMSRNIPAGKKDGHDKAAPLVTGMPREGSKLANVIGLLDRADGVSLDDLIQATSWLPHTTRAALTGLRKRGLDIERSREAGVTTYRIVRQAAGGLTDSPSTDRPEDAGSTPQKAKAA
jgi:hypothetical protein